MAQWWSLTAETCSCVYIKKSSCIRWIVNELIAFEYFLCRVETGHLQVLQYRSLYNKVKNVNDFCEVSQMMGSKVKIDYSQFVILNVVLGKYKKKYKIETTVVTAVSVIKQ